MLRLRVEFLTVGAGRGRLGGQVSVGETSPSRGRRRPDGRQRLAAAVRDRTTKMLRTILALAGLALATAAPAQTTWPDLTDANSRTFVSNRLGLPTATLATTPAAKAWLSHIYQVSPPYSVSTVQLLFANFYVDGAGAVNPERCPGNGKIVDFATVFVGAAAYPVTFGGGLSARIGDCEFLWSDPILDASKTPLTLPAGTTYFVRSSQSVANAGELMTWNMSGLYGLRDNPLNGGGTESTASPQTAKRLSGTVGGNKAMGGPAAAIGTGWDGSPVFLVVGDSIAAGAGDYAPETSTRAVLGYVGRGLDDAGSTRMNFANWAIPGSRSRDQASIATGQYRLRMRVLQSVRNKPFNRIFSEMGTNNVSEPLAQHQAEQRDWWQMWRNTCPSCPIYQTTYLPNAGQTTYSYWTDQANQVASGATNAPGGYRDQVLDWYRGGRDLPSYLTVIDAGAAGADPAVPQNWRNPPGGWTLGAATNAGATSMTLAGALAPTVGDWVVVEPGSTAYEQLTIASVAGTGPWTVTLQNNGGAPGNGTVAKPHAGGVAVMPMPTTDGTHPTTQTHKAAAAVIAAKKADGTIH